MSRYVPTSEYSYRYLPPRKNYMYLFSEDFEVYCPMRRCGLLDLYHYITEYVRSFKISMCSRLTGKCFDCEGLGRLWGGNAWQFFADLLHLETFKPPYLSHTHT